MWRDRWLILGIIGAALSCLACLTPVAVLALGAIGLGAWTGVRPLRPRAAAVREGPGGAHGSAEVRDKEARVTFESTVVSVNQLIEAVNRGGFRAVMKRQQ
jgi:hypothetical protein